MVYFVFSLESPQWGDSNENTQYTPSCYGKAKGYLYFAFGSGAMINTHQLELPLSRTYFHSPKGVRTIELRLYHGLLACTEDNRLAEVRELSPRAGG